ncbi:stage III sporulation protein AA [Paenibacillus sp. 1_12]|uniref:stage III sporulation protein AA n=1 Tax=Paenibacillus sp. 1_12 TaxID=1566278 RepID=UPI0008EAD7F3|nr:stage III sporulation protein AA [Paenibacillus sp. 1_12]SFK93993.1 stage III sporulation protein AA [Paenibacillus sp. 1_12]
MQSLLQLFSVPLRQRLSMLPSQIMQDLQEIRVREQRPLEIGWGRQYSFVSQTGGLSNNPDEAYRPNREDCAALLEMLTQHSLYTFEEELRRGFITVAGGHRIGLAGRTVLEQGKVKLLKDISSFNIRIAKEHKGCGNSIIPYVTDSTGQGCILHTLIVSPPQQGKTTLIRDLARIISKGPVSDSGTALRRGYKVGIVDERSEIAACVRGVPRFELGPRTDVLDGCPKAEGMMMMIRSMSPELLIVDEIGRPEDAAAIHEAIHAGIAVMATAHGLNYEDISRRPVLKELLHDQVFKRIVVLSSQSSVGSLEGIYDSQGRRLTLTSSGVHGLAEAREQGRAMVIRSGQQEGISLC